ncbi:unnamed protein product, partial [Phaeothamnion confervicola]
SLISPLPTQPFRGLVSYAGPVCFLYERCEPSYTVLRRMYARLWCRLNTVRSASGCLPQLLRLVEDLLQAHAPALSTRLRIIGAAPARLAAPWLQLGFVGLLEADQVLALWDRLLAWGGRLELLAALAAAVLVFKGEALAAAADAAEVRDLLADGSRLRVVPLLQAFLFPDSVAA